MAKKQPRNSSPKYYVYYDKQTGKILSATNEISTRYDYGLEIPFAEFEKFMSGEYKFQDFVVGYKNLNDKSTLSLLLRDRYGADYTFRNSMVVWITEQSKDAECVVEWDKSNSTWNFYLDENYKKNYNSAIRDMQLLFFVTLETDFDFLIRTISIRVSDLLESNNISIPFESTMEFKIDKISISTNSILKSYKLKVINE